MMVAMTVGTSTTVKHTAYLVEHHHHGCSTELPNHQAFGGLCLDALGDIHDEQHDVDDLRAADDGADERCVAGTVN